MPTRKLTRAEAEILEDSISLPDALRISITNLLNRSEGGISIVVTKSELPKIEAVLNPHMAEGLVYGRLLLGIVMALLLSGVFSTTTSASGDICTRWSINLGAEGRTADSIQMHSLGCDDNGFNDGHYTKDDNTCASLQRKIAYAKYGYGKPDYHYVTRVVKNVYGHTVFEDGTCEFVVRAN